MIEWYENLPLFDQAIFLLLTLSFCLVMFCCLISFQNSRVGWYRGFHSSPIFQILMWAGSLPLILPLIVLYIMRRRAIHSAKLIGNIRSRVFHKPECEYQRKIYSNVFKFPLKSPEDAEKRGFKACRWCHPTF